MTTISGKPNLFFVTSPRSPHKMMDEVKVLVENFAGQKWERNRQLQEDFYRQLASQDFFTGTLTGEIDFKARDRITRGPKSLGLVNLSPQIALTDAGKAYVYGKRPHEIFTRQLLKFQLPSPYHIDKEGVFFVKPYLELFRLISDLETLSKDEIAAFATQLIHFNKYDEVKRKIEDFRQAISELERRRTNYKRYFDKIFSREIISIYAERIGSGDIQLRESRSATTEKFIQTKKRNHIDYADAAIRYLRETQLVSLTSGRSNKICIPEEKEAEVAFILENVPREPHYTTNINEFRAYLFDASQPILYSDDRDRLIQAILKLSPEQLYSTLLSWTLDDLKDFKDSIIQENLDVVIATQINQLQLYEEYDDIIATYADIKARNVFDAPLAMEWNTWRAFVMLDDGEIIGNFRFDDAGKPLSTASGNQADIVCEYGDFDVLVEVTLSTGKRQYEIEGEPVARHLGDHQKQSDKDSYCIFIASKLNQAALSHFYMLHKYEVAYYGGRARIIPLSLQDFQIFLEQAYRYDPKPTAATIKAFVQKASDLAVESSSEAEWYEGVRSLTSSWV